MTMPDCFPPTIASIPKEAKPLVKTARGDQGLIEILQEPHSKAVFWVIIGGMLNEQYGMDDNACQKFIDWLMNIPEDQMDEAIRMIMNF